MKPIKQITLCVTLLNAFLLCRNVCAQDFSYPINVMGEERSSGNSILATITLANKAFSSPVSVPDNPNSLRTEKLEPLTYNVAARGVAAPSQGVDGAVLYWRGFDLWRYERGNHRKIIDRGSTRYRQVFPVVESLGHNIAVPIEQRTFGNIKIILDLLAATKKDDLYFPASSDNLKPIGWTQQEQLVALEYMMDKVGRLQKSRLVLLKPVNEKDDDNKLEQKKYLTGLGEKELIVKAYVANSKVALQAYNQETERFRLAVVDLNLGEEVQWIPLPEGRKEGWYEGVFNKKVTQMSLSPDGRYFQVCIPGNGISIWDTKEKQWLRRGNDIIFARIENSSGFLWLDSDHVISFEPSIAGSTFLLGGKISEYSRSLTVLGEIEGILVEQIFKG